MDNELTEQQVRKCREEARHDQSLANKSGNWSVSYDELLSERLNAILRSKQQAETPRKPDGYAYRYHDCIRFNQGQMVNGGKPIEAIPFFYGEPAAPPSLLAKLRELRDRWAQVRGCLKDKPTSLGCHRDCAAELDALIKEAQDAQSNGQEH